VEEAEEAARTMPIREVCVHSLGELIDQVTPSEPDLETGRHRDTGVYRGVRNAEWPLLTSLDRLGGGERPHSKAGLEAHIFRNFIRYSRPYLVSTPGNDWEYLVSAQHHGVPTRLLDWTYSPLIAAHFATLPRPGERTDRAVWRLDWQRVHRHFGFPALALGLDDLGRNLPGGDALSPWDLFDADARERPFACMLEPPSVDPRMVGQSAVFTLCSTKSQSFDAFLAAHGLDDALSRIVIPVADAPRIRDQLDMVGADERRLFPDLDGVAAKLRRYYG
jgi:hypothetical protein